MNAKQRMNAAHPSYLGWQVDWPLYVKVPVLKVSNRVFTRGDYLPWAEMKQDPAKIATLYSSGMVYHDAVKSTEEGYGDRLGEINMKNLKGLVILLNDHLKKEHCATEEQFKRKRCRQSVKPETQRVYLRQFLSKNPYMTDFFLKVRDNYITKFHEEEA